LLLPAAAAAVMRGPNRLPAPCECVCVPRVGEGRRARARAGMRSLPGEVPLRPAQPAPGGGGGGDGGGGTAPRAWGSALASRPSPLPPLAAAQGSARAPCCGRERGVKREGGRGGAGLSLPGREGPAPRTGRAAGGGRPQTAAAARAARR
jgi:hypothetical protein